MGIVYQKDKRSGITYAYESTSYWVKEKQQSRSTRTLVGRVDPATGEIVATDGRRKKQAQNKDRDDLTLPKRHFFGATYLFDQIGKKLGITADLQRCFPETYQQILSLAYFLILEHESSLSRFSRWAQTHRHPYGRDVLSQRCSELFASITGAHRHHFFTLRRKRKEETEYWVYDTTTISSHSQLLKQVKYGKNKEYDRLAQINLALVFGQRSQIPYYYRNLAGNIPDKKTLKQLLVDLQSIGYEKIKMVLDRGFYSKENVNAMYQDHMKFLLAAPMGISFIRKHLEPLYDRFRSYDHYDRTYELYAHTVTTTWNYEQDRPYKQDTLVAQKRIYIHYYFNIDKAADEEKAFDQYLLQLREELESGNRITGHEKHYKNYFSLKTTPKRGTVATVNHEAIAAAKRYHGFFALISNQKMGAMEALQVYRNKDVIEKAFHNLKDRLGMRRARVSSQQSLEGKLFVQFIALIYVSYIKKHMQESRLFESYSIQGVLDTLDVIECYAYPGKKLRVGELLKKQHELYTKLGVDPPSSL